MRAGLPSVGGMGMTSSIRWRLYPGMEDGASHFEATRPVRAGKTNQRRSPFGLGGNPCYRERVLSAMRAGDYDVAKVLFHRNSIQVPNKLHTNSIQVPLDFPCLPLGPSLAPRCMLLGHSGKPRYWERVLSGIGAEVGGIATVLRRCCSIGIGLFLPREFGGPTVSPPSPSLVS